MSLKTFATEPHRRENAKVGNSRETLDKLLRKMYSLH
jgi:hypothetical protein